MDNQQEQSSGAREPSRAELQKERNIQNNAKNIRNAADVAIASKNPYGVAIGGAVKAADKISGGKATEGLGKAMNTMSKMSIRGRQMQALSNKLSESGASDAIGKAAAMKNAADGNKSSAVGASGKNSPTGNNSDGGKTPGGVKSAKQKDAEDSQRSLESGTFQVGFKRATLIKLGLFCSIMSFSLILFLAMIATIADNEGAAIVMGEMVSEDKDLVKDISGEIGDEMGQGGYDEVVNVGMSSDNFGMGAEYDDEYFERFEILGNAFSSENVKCEGSECKERPEFRYYLKIADIALRYKNKYNINLDWILLSATAQYNDMTQEAIMEAHMHDYDLDAVEDYEKLMDLDWDYDYKKIPNYTYLDPDDYRYDLQILAKNMVAKTTHQSCTKRVEDEEGNVTYVVTKSRTDQDIEEQYFEPGQPYHLKCDAGESYARDSDYKLSPEKYDEFLLEYLEHKFYLDAGLPTYTWATKSFTKYDLTDDQIAQLASLAYHEQGTARGAAAEASLMANLFELKGSSYGEGAEGLYNYVRNSGWFAHAATNMDSYDASPEIIAAVRSVLVDGKRTIPGYIDEHDWINDLTSVTNNGVSINKTDRSKYVQYETVLKNKYGATYTFYSFPDTNSDPFGYTSEAKREEIGECYYDFDTGEPVDCTVSGEFIFPLPDGATSCRSSAFGYRYHPISGKYHYHSGDDYPAAGGTPVYAVADGVVSAAGFHSSMGNYIYIDHANGIRSIYMHASALHVKTGDNVKQGDTIMSVGTTGSSTGNHLHITFKKDGKLDDPANYIVTLPMCS